MGYSVNPKAGEDGSGALPQEEPQRLGATARGRQKVLRSGVPEALKPGSSRWLARAALFRGGRPGLLTCADADAAAGAGDKGAAMGWRAGEARGGRRGFGGCGWESSPGWALSGRPECSGWRSEEPRAFKGALTFLGFPLTNGRPRGRKREGGQSGFLSPPPAAWRTTFQLEGEGGRRGSGPRSTGTSQKNRCPPTRPWRSRAQHSGSGAKPCARIQSRRGPNHANQDP